MKTCYDILGVPPHATAKQIKTAFRSLAMIAHQDLGGSDAKFIELSEAYEKAMTKTKSQRVTYVTVKSIPVNISMREAYYGVEKTIDMVVRGETGGIETASVPLSIPPRFESGHVIRIDGVGDFVASDQRAPIDFVIIYPYSEGPYSVDQHGNIFVEMRVPAARVLLGSPQMFDLFDGPLSVNIVMPEEGLQPFVVRSETSGFGKNSRVVVNVVPVMPKGISDDDRTKLVEILSKYV